MNCKLCGGELLKIDDEEEFVQVAIDKDFFIRSFLPVHRCEDCSDEPGYQETIKQVIDDLKGQLTEEKKQMIRKRFSRTRGFGSCGLHVTVHFFPDHGVPGP